MKQRIMRLLNIRANESSLVFRLMGVQFLMGLGIAFLVVSSYTFFLYKYPVTQLPWIYIALGTLLFPVNGLYNRLDQRLNSYKLMQLVLLTSAVTVTMFLAAWLLLPNFATAVLLVAWNIVVYFLIGYSFWGLASLLFNVRESRRVFSVIGSGDLPAKILGYVTISLTAGILPLEVMMGFAVLFFLLASWLAKYSLGHSKINWEEYEDSQHVHQPPGASWWNRFFGSRLIMAISALSFVAYMVTFIMDFTFLSEIKVRNKSAAELTAFLSIFFGIGRVVAILFKLLFTSRFLSRMGIASTLFFTPLILLVLAVFGVMVTKGVLELSGGFYLYLFAAMVLLSEVLRSALQEPVFFVLFQPLSIHLRLKGHLIAKGYVLPPALFLLGSFLLYWTERNHGLAIGISLTFVLILVIVWMMLIPWVKKTYFQAVSKSIGKGIFSGAALFLQDRNVMHTLANKVKTGTPLEVIHALDLLEKSEYEGFESLMIEQLKRSQPEIQMYVLDQVASRRMLSAIPALREMNKGELSEKVRSRLVKTLLAINDSEQLLLGTEAMMQQDSFEWKQQLLEIRLRHKEEGARQELRELALSQVPRDRLMAASSIAGSAYIDGLHLVEQLVHDPEPKVKEEALKAAGILQLQSLIPVLLDQLKGNSSAAAARIALGHYGDDLFASPRVKPTGMVNSQLTSLLYLAGSCKGEYSEQYLENLLGHEEVRTELVVDALWKKGYAFIKPNVTLLTQWMQLMKSAAEEKKGIIAALDHYEHFEPLSTAIFNEYRNHVISMLQLLGILYGKEKIKRLVDLVQSNRSAGAATAIELLELNLPPKLASGCSSLVEYLLERRQGPAPSHASGKLQLPQVLGEILEHGKKYSHWATGMTYYLMGKFPLPAYFSLLAQYPEHKKSKLVHESRNYLIAHLKNG